MESNSTAILIKIKLRHSLGRPSRSDFVQWGFVEVSGKIIIEPQYTKARSFANGYAAVCNENDLWGFLNDKNELCIDYTYRDAPDEFKIDMKRQIIMTAVSDGFFSVWTNVFTEEPQILSALIENFPGTNKLKSLSIR